MQQPQNGGPPRVMKVKNKQPADRQITAEQILRESKDIQLEDGFTAPKQIITDPEELAEYRLKKRKEFEDNARRVGRFQMTVWFKYASWEESQKDFRRARSIWERALDIDYRNVTMWLKYAEMEMRHRFVNHARNVWDRAVTLLPRIDQLWYKYIHMEEMLGNMAGARQVFERWMRFEPDHAGWMAYVKFELRYAEVGRSRDIFERYCQVLPSVKSWVRYAKFEMKDGETSLARTVYERAVEELGEDAQTEEFFIKFAEFEEKVKELERARAIYKYALDHIPKGQAVALYARFVSFEKQHGDREGIEEVVVSKRRFQYEEEVQRAPLNYDNWFDYIKLEESAGDVERTREVYERAVANLPPGPEKRYWQRYIYLWVKYALWEEVDTNEPSRAREVYRAALRLVPHRSFTFAKLWVMAAKFEVRQKRVDAARTILGMGLGMAPKEKLFKAYIELEGQLGNVDRCRKLYEKYLEWSPANCTAWIKFAEMEKGLGEGGRTRALYELAIAQPVLDIPEGLWKSYIDFEIGEGERGRVRVLYQRLLDRSKHVKVWLSFAQFEAAPMPEPAVDEEDEAEAEARAAAARLAAASGPESARSRSEAASRVYARGYTSLREVTPDSKEEAVMLLEAWKAHEAAGAAFRSAEEQATAVAAVAKHAPRRVKRKRPITTEDGMEVGMEEYIDWIFPEEAGAAPNLKLLQAAYRWKKQKTADTDAAAAAAAAASAPPVAGAAPAAGAATAAAAAADDVSDGADDIEIEDGMGGGGGASKGVAGDGSSSPEEAGEGRRVSGRRQQQGGDRGAAEADGNDGGDQHRGSSERGRGRGSKEGSPS
ncbi:MAG: hypothetical protein WDW36_002999 [Sanguina aurantia]